MQERGQLKEETLVQELAVLTQKMGSNESWAASFVALYFAFLTSIGTATGFILSSRADIELSKSSSSREDCNACIAISSLEDLLLVALPTLGIALNIWAVAMVIDYKRSTRILMEEAGSIEQKLLSIGNHRKGFASRTMSNNSSAVWKSGTFVVVGSVMFMLLTPWLVVLLYAVR